MCLSVFYEIHSNMHGSDRKLQVLLVEKLREHFILIARVESYGTETFFLSSNKNFEMLRSETPATRYITTITSHF